MSGRWEVPIELQLHGDGRYRIVQSTYEAAECLMMFWPHEHGEKLSAAKLACLRALEGKVGHARAREAFLDAANEAGFFVKQS